MSFNIVAVSTAGSSRRLFTPTNSLFRTTTISPDGRTLAFVANNNDRDDIWTIPLVTGSVPKQATFSPNSRVFFANLVFSPDGRTIYFDKQEEVHTISMFENFN